MPTIEELLNLKDQSLSSFLPKKDDEETIVSDALVSPVRPEFLSFLEKRKKEKSQRPDGTRSLLGSSSPEELAIKDLNEYDTLKGLSSAQKSAFDDSRLADLAKMAKPSPSEANAPSKPFFPTLTGAPIPEDSLKISQAAPLSRTPATPPPSKEPAVASEEGALAGLLKSQDSEQSRYADLLNRFKDSQERQRTAQLGVGLTQAAERIGSAIAMTKPGDQAPYEQAMKLAGRITDEFKEQEAVAREAEKNDPNSAESKSARALLKQQGINIPDNITAAFIEKQYPQFANIINRKESVRLEGIRRQERAEERQERMLERLDGKKRELALRLAPKIQNKKYETYTELLAQKNLVDEAVRNPSPQRDITVYYSFVKALDPESVVREGELKFVQTSRSIPDDLRGALQSALTGKPMLDKERLEIQKFMNQRLQLSQKQWQDSAAPFLKQTAEAGIDQELVAPGTSAVTQQAEEKRQASTSSKPGYKGPVVRQNGIEYKWNEQLGKYE